MAMLSSAAFTLGRNIGALAVESSMALDTASPTISRLGKRISGSPPSGPTDIPFNR